MEFALSPGSVALLLQRIYLKWKKRISVEKIQQANTLFINKVLIINRETPSNTL